MLSFTIITGIIGLLCGILLFVPLYIFIEYTKDAMNNEFKLKIKYLGITVKSIPRKMNKKQSPKKKQVSAKEEFSLSNFKQDAERYLDGFQAVKEDVFQILDFLSKKTVRIKEITIDLDFGFSDPMSTGIMTGVFNGIAYNALGALNHWFTVQDWAVNIQPDFNIPKLDVCVRGILKIKNVHIIIIAIKIIRMYFRFPKGTSNNSKKQ